MTEAVLVGALVLVAALAANGLSALVGDSFWARLSGRRSRFFAGALLALVAVGAAALAGASARTETSPVATEGLPDKLSIRRECGVDGEDSVTGAFWGPGREEFRIDDPAPYPTLNGIVDNPYFGDERPFFDVKNDLDEKKDGLCNSLRVEDGDIVLMRLYIENSAADSLIGKDFDGPGVARGVRLKIRQDGQVSSLRQVYAELSADNTDPAMIYDGIELSAEQPFRIDFILDSGRIYTNFKPRGKELLSDPWRGDGTTVGVPALNGILPPGYEYSAIITVRARISFVQATG